MYLQENVEHSVHRGEEFKATFPYLTFDESVNQIVCWLIVVGLLVVGWLVG